MLEKDKLRKADVFTGIIFFLFGLFIVSQALQMPMKDSWGGVQNVWYVSPALFPLFVGGVITLLGLILVYTSIREVGFAVIQQSVSSLLGPKGKEFFTSPATLRFYSICSLFIFYVYMNLPRVDFLLCSQLFLVAFITMFYFDDSKLLAKLFKFYLTVSLGFAVYFFTGINTLVSNSITFASDYLTILFIIAYIIYTRQLIRHKQELVRKFRISLIVALTAPIILALVFKYFLLVPLVHEGLVITVMDTIRYGEF